MLLQGFAGPHHFSRQRSHRFHPCSMNGMLEPQFVSVQGLPRHQDLIAERVGGPDESERVLHLLDELAECLL